MSHRLQVVLPDPIHEQLLELASGARQPPATLAGQMVRAAVGEAAKSGQVRAVKPTAVLAGRRDGCRARWLEPYGGDADWRALMWGSILALHGRYPRRLRNLKDGWWDDEVHVEVLCALATWRNELDDNGEDPREELAFHTQLRDYSRSLEKQGSLVDEWKPGAPPDSWATKTISPPANPPEPGA